MREHRSTSRAARAMRPRASLLAVLASGSLAALAAVPEPLPPGPLKIGEIEPYFDRTPHPYPGHPGRQLREPVMVWSRTIVHPRASYIKVHFQQFLLAPGDFLVVRSPDDRQRYAFTDRGKAPSGDFWGTHVKGDTAILELMVTSPTGGYGFDIVEYARGYELPPAGSPDTVCGAEDWENAKCYSGTVYTRARAVARLHIGATSACSGWLVGCDGSLLTNNHCLQNQADVNNTDFEFMGEGGNCGSSCDSWMACPGSIWGGAGTFLRTSNTYDYTLVRLAGNPQSTYGYLQMRNGPVTLDEDTYLVHHPNAWGKKISFNSSHGSNPQGRCELDSINTSGLGCDAVPKHGYYCDTAGGSSGSPMIADADDQVVALHNCGGCQNSGLRVTDVIADMGCLVPPCAVTGCIAPPAPSGLTATAGTGVVDLAWTNNGPCQDAVRVYRGTSSGGPYTLIATLAASATTHTDSTGTPGTNYCYVVRAVENNGGPCESGNSNEACATPTGGCGTPTFAGVQSAVDQSSCADTGVLVSWNVPSSWGSGATGGTYEVQRSDRANCGSPIVIVSGLATTSYVDNSGANGTNYRYKVRAVNSCGLGSDGGVCSPQVADVVGGGAPVFAGITSASDADACADTGVNLAWSAPSNWNDPGGSRSYRVYRATTLVATLAEGTTTHNDNGGTNGTTYAYRVEAVNGCALVSDGGASLSAADAVAAAPTFGGATGASDVDACADSGVRITWNAVSAWGAPTGTYEVVRHTGGSCGGAGTTIATALTGTSYVDTTGTNGTSYTYRVVARSSCNLTSDGGACAGPAADAVAAAPTFAGITSAVDVDGCADTGIQIGWSAVSSWGAASGTYEVVRCSAASCGGSCTTVATGLTGTTYTDNGGTNGTSYSYRVVARNACNLTADGGACSALVADQTGSAPTWTDATVAVDADACAATGNLVSWGAVTSWGSGAGTYRVIRSTKASCGNPTTTVATGLTGTSFLDTTAAAGTAYYYRVEAVNSCTQVAVGACTGPATDVADTTPPGAVGNGVGNAKSGGNMTISWPDVAGETAYDVYEAASPSLPFPAGWTLVHTAAANTTSWTTAQGAGNRHFKVRARDACGNVSD